MASEWDDTAWAGNEVFVKRDDGQLVPLALRDTPPDDSLAGLFGRLSPVRSTVWKPASVREALGVPAIFRAVSLIANTVGALSLDCYRNGAKMAPEDRPRLVVRPDPFRRPREFFRDTAWNMASRGEAWWWIARRDVDGSALSLLNLPPQQVSVAWNLNDLRYPIVTWRGVVMPIEDILHLTFAQEPAELRGVGPLQLCGAAISVAVEAQEFAANFYGAGGYPSTVIKHASTLDGTLRDETGAPDPNGLSEADRLRAQWLSAPNNTPRVIDQDIESITQHEPTAQGAATLTTRDYQNGDAARMFGIPGSLLEYGYPGSTVTYQNVGQELDKFTRVCLWPNYLEPIEQAISDLLTRSTIARFNTDALLRADVQTRWNVYKLAVDVLGPADAAALARQAEGIDPGSVENAPVPLAPPQAIPDALPIQANAWAFGIVAREAPEPVKLAGPEPIVTRIQVLSMRAALQAQGKPAGHASIARELHVSESTVRRRLSKAA